MKRIDKPWGVEEIIEINDRYMFKRLTMLKGHRCSLQYHNTKRETIYVLSGDLRILSGPSEKEMLAESFGPGGTITLAPGVVHRMEAAEDSVYLEASTPELDDVVRIGDDYKRAG
ncbi:MAG: hypothetical protein RQ748_05580 [Elusimicrobiales bacterium]|nr:hypothetical protein [Elusimicrobiales bacterium]